MARRAERGLLLLEVLIALALLAVTSASLSALLVQAIDARRITDSAERRTREASRLLAAVSLLTRADLEERLGERRAGDSRVSIQRASGTLYAVRVATEGAPPLESVLYRAAPR